MAATETEKTPLEVLERSLLMAAQMGEHTWDWMADPEDRRRAWRSHRDYLRRLRRGIADIHMENLAEGLRLALYGAGLQALEQTEGISGRWLDMGNEGDRPWPCVAIPFDFPYAGTFGLCMEPEDSDGVDAGIWFVTGWEVDAAPIAMGPDPVETLNTLLEILDR